MHFHAVILIQMEGDITRVHKIIRKKLFDQIPLIATTNYKFINPISAVDLKNVPKNRLPADLNHWLRL